MAVATTQRDDLLVLIHKALRAGLFRAAADAGSIDWQDRAQVESLERRWSRIVKLVLSHAAHEDKHIWPLLESKRPGAVAEMGIGHDAVDADIEAADREFQKALENPSDGTGLTFYRTLTQFIGHAMEHFASEEPAAMEILWATCSDEELAECRAAFMAEIPPDEQSWTLELILESSTPHEQLQVLGGLQRSMPPEAFATWVSGAQHSLSDRALRRLESSVAKLSEAGTPA
jgi:hypothetical protein